MRRGTPPLPGPPGRSQPPRQSFVRLWCVQPSGWLRWTPRPCRVRLTSSNHPLPAGWRPNGSCPSIQVTWIDTKAKATNPPTLQFHPDRSFLFDGFDARWMRRNQEHVVRHGMDPQRTCQRGGWDVRRGRHRRNTYDASMQRKGGATWVAWDVPTSSCIQGEDVHLELSLPTLLQTCTRNETRLSMRLAFQALRCVSCTCTTHVRLRVHVDPVGSPTMGPSVPFRIRWIFCGSTSWSNLVQNRITYEHTFPHIPLDQCGSCIRQIQKKTGSKTIRDLGLSRWISIGSIFPSMLPRFGFRRVFSTTSARRRTNHIHITSSQAHAHLHDASRGSKGRRAQRTTWWQPRSST